MKEFNGRRYDVIYADPPWEVKKILRRSRPNQTIMDYPVMKLEDIKKMEVEAIANDDSCLFLWVTHKWLEGGLEVMKSWGFRYQRLITWDKGNGMTSHGFHHRTEMMLYGYRGKSEFFKFGKAMPTLVSGKSFRHSEKPDSIREMIERFGEKRVELFARKTTDGWDAWGNEIECGIKLEEWREK